MSKEEKEICIGKKSGKTYNKIQEMAKEIVRLQKENEDIRKELKVTSQMNSNLIVKLQKENKKYIDTLNATEKIMNGQERTKDKLLKENVELQKENEDMREELQMYVDTPISKLKEENKKLKRENEALDIIHETYKEVIDNGDFFSKDEIKQIIGYEENEDVSKDEIISLLKTMWEEFNRLEDIEDKMFTKYISKDIIRNFIKEELPDDEIMESCEMFDMNGVYLRKKLEELLGE